MTRDILWHSPGLPFMVDGYSRCTPKHIIHVKTFYTSVEFKGLVCFIWLSKLKCKWELTSVAKDTIKDHNVDSIIMPCRVTISQFYVRMLGQNGNRNILVEHFVLKESSTSCLWEWFFIVEYRRSQLFRFYCSQGDWHVQINLWSKWGDFV